MSRPTVTVLTAVHDAERHLPESVESILEQTYGAFELVVVDDASTDSSRAIVESYGDPRVRVLVNERNLGLTASLNRGLEEARGLYVARQDADDVSEPKRLERQVELLERRPDVALVASHHRRIDEEGRHGGDRFVPTNALDIHWRLLFLNAFAHSSVTFRLDVVRELGGFDERFLYAQDYELWSRLARSHRAAAVPEILVSYRRSARSLTATFARAGEEVREIAAENLRAVGVDPQAVDREAARQLLFGDPRRIDARGAVAAARAVADVHRAFARAAPGSGREIARHRARVRLRLGRALADLGLRERDPKALAWALRLAVSAALPY